MPGITKLQQGAPLSLDYSYGRGNLTADGITVTAYVTNADGSFIEPLTVTIPDQTTSPGRYQVYGGSSAWPLGPLKCISVLTHSGTHVFTQEDNFTLSACASTTSGSTANPAVHTQSSAATEWIVNHNLGRRPAGVEVLTPGGLSVNAEIVHMSANQLRVYFVAPQTGSVLAL